LQLKIGKQDIFANKRKISINLVEPSKDLKALHQLGLAWFDKLEARWAVKNPHVDNDFIPHIRRRVGHNVKKGERIIIPSLSLVRAFRRGDDLRTVAAKVVLK
jgi:hypothetical protein